jgi:hypothetical protein
MTHVKKGHLAASPEWRKHLRRWLKRQFWKRHRQAEQKELGGAKAICP